MKEPPRAVTLKGYYRYDSGHAYRIWTVTQDVPEVPAPDRWIDEVGGPSHLSQGDELREDRGDRGLFFRVERDDLTIGRLEWWQVGNPVFGGVLPAWKGKRRKRGGSLSHAAPGLRVVAMHRSGLIWKVTAPDPALGLKPGYHVRELRVRDGRTTVAWVYDGAEQVVQLTLEELHDLFVRSFDGRTIGRLRGFSGKGESGGLVAWELDNGEGSCQDVTGMVVWRDDVGRWGFDAREVTDPGYTYKEVWVEDSETIGILHKEQVRTAPDLSPSVRAIGERNSYQASVAMLQRTVEMPTMTAHPGDLITLTGGHECAGARRPLAVEDMEALRAVYDAEGKIRGAYRWLEDVTPGTYLSIDEGVAKVIGHRNRWGTRKKAWSPVLTLVRPVIPEPVSAPVQAPHDAGALFELVASCGGTLSNGSEADRG